MALVVTLAVLALLVFLVVAFLDRSIVGRRVSGSSNNMIQSEELARSAVDFLKGEIAAEIRSSSNSIVVTSGNGTASVYLPQTASAQVPQISGVPANSSPNLVKMSSASSTALHTGGRAVTSPSSPSTSTPDASGLSLGADFWFGARGPQLGSAAGGAVPAWVYVTKSGGVEPLAFDAARHGVGGDDEVVGRFAFTIYDTGGLIDLNLAGAPGGVPVDDRSQGGSLGLADLSTVGLDQEMVDQILAFRNPDLATAPAAYLDLLFKPSSTTDWHPAQAGFRAVKRGHRPFISRAQLIQFWKTKGWDLALLERLTNATSDIEAPSFDPVILPFPGNTTATNYGRAAYADYPDPKNSGRRITINPPQRLASSPGAIKKRFPLERITWLENKANNPSDSSRDSDIRDAFGLQWNAGDRAWDYVDGDLSAGLVNFKIKTLQEVEAAGREPNFFEILKAAIYPGSLGSANRYNDARKALAATSASSPQHFFDENPDLQIIRIGANIIDQWDADSFPTEINVNTIGFYGIEDLPYFSEIVVKAHRDPDATRNAQNRPIWADITDNPNATYDLSICFELWNPHQPSPNTTSARPSNIRVKAVAGTWEVTARCIGSGGNATSYEAPGDDRYSKTFNGETFEPAASLTLNAFRSPEFASNAGGGQFINSLGKNGFALPSLNQFTIVTPPTTPTGVMNSQPRFFRVANTVFSLEYERNGVWKTYASFAGFPDNPALSGWNQGTNFNTDLELHSGNTRYPFPAAAPYMGIYGARYMHPDPRSNRWGGSRGRSPWTDDCGLSDNQGFLPMLTRSQLTMTDSGRPASIQYPNPFTLPTDWYHQNPQRGIETSPMNSSGSFSTMEPVDSTANGGNKLPGLLYSNDPASTTPNSRAPDPDNVTRPADGLFVPASNNPSARFWSGSLPGGACASTSRPIILNRPFRTVGELGFAYRDQPWKTLDLFTDQSADAALLDFFCLHEIDAEGTDEDPPLVAGRVSLNTPHKEVLKAILKGTAKAPWLNPSIAANVFSDSEADSIATAVVANGPYRNRAELVAKLEDLGNTTLLGTTKVEREAVIRALGQVSQTRAWNLLVDITAQAGKFARTASGPDKFLVEAQRRYWVELVVDRFTGRVLETRFTNPIE